MSKPSFTPGPWRWEVRPKDNRVELISSKNGDSVLRTARWGMFGAMLEFVKDGLFCHITEFMKPFPRRDHHASWMQTIEHPDARLIAASPNLYEKLNQLTQWAQIQHQTAEYETQAESDASEALIAECGKLLAGIVTPAQEATNAPS
jgi:acyl-coenzyme A synthetase/AMP-(fatty) acid ligase